MSFDYAAKFVSFQNHRLYQRLKPNEQAFIRSLAFDHHFSFQEFRQVVEACRDLAMWRKEGIEAWWRNQLAHEKASGPLIKNQLLRKLHAYLTQLREAPIVYPPARAERLRPKKVQTIVTRNSEKSIAGQCPVASPKTMCCNLHTIDAVAGCAFGCSYCTIQTFYEGEIVFDADFGKKLSQIKIDPDRFFHYGTGQASDSLVWGDRNGNLTELCLFALRHPNVLLEFKTKSDNIRFFLENEIPPNVVCSWSLNTPTIIANEEHLTANLEQRIAAARALADRGIAVAFHFHPMVCYQGWEVDYPELAKRLLGQFQPEEVLFISFGSVTFIKPVIQKIRELGNPTKILQMRLMPDPHGKLTYPDGIKIKMFQRMCQAFSAWREHVFFYLCMEKASIWEEVFGFAYPSNQAFEFDFGHKTLGRWTRTNGRVAP